MDPTKMNFTDTSFSSVMLNITDNTPRLLVFNVCIDLPQKIIADGIWSSHTAFPSKSTFTMLELQIITIFLVTQGFHFFLKRFGFSYFVSQVMAGFLLGPSITTGPLNYYKKKLFPFGSPDILSTLSSFGYAFFLFLNSVQMDLTLITKTGKKAWVIALLGFFTPLIIGDTVIATYFGFWNRILTFEEAFSLPTVVISQSSCSFAVITSMLNDLGILNSELGRLALSSAFLTELTSSFITGLGTCIVTSYVNGSINGLIVIRRSLSYIAYLFGILLIGRPVMRWMVKTTPVGRRINKIYVHAIVISFLVLSYFAGQFKQPFYFGAVILGLAVPEGPPLGSELVQLFELFSNRFLTPIFVTCCVMKVDLTKCQNHYVIAAVAGFILAVHLVKYIQCMGICLYCRMPLTDGLCLALILSCKGLVDCCSFILLYDAVRQSPETIGVMVISVLILETISRTAVKCLYDPSRKYAGYQKRNIMNLKQHSELRLVACVRKPGHIVHIKNFLQLCSPTLDNTLVADVLHLIELIGRSAPIFIAHRLRGGSSTCNYSEELVVTFDLFERDYVGKATANTYTAISPVTFMHEDVTSLALDKNASIIILPFHIKWTEDGSIDSEDNINIRSLNSKVLEKAPCSIGILVNRGGGQGHNQSTSYRVAMIFLGGPDDREALCLAKRFAKNLDNTLCVYRLRAYNHDTKEWEHMIDDEELREVRGVYVKLENVTYEERTIEDASHTTNFIRDIANKFDFFLVGRRNGVNSPQTAGLENWTEYAELGVVGDLLASPDMDTKASILVVQQQQTTSLLS